jgi:hypothetical protein
MATTVIVDPSLDAILTKIALSKVKHPTTNRRTFVNLPIEAAFGLGTDGATPTVTLSVGITSEWPYADEPDKTFNVSELG